MHNKVAELDLNAPRLNCGAMRASRNPTQPSDTRLQCSLDTFQSVGQFSGQGCTAQRDNDSGCVGQIVSHLSGAQVPEARHACCCATDGLRHPVVAERIAIKVKARLILRGPFGNNFSPSRWVGDAGTCHGLLVSVFTCGDSGRLVRWVADFPGAAFLSLIQISPVVGQRPGRHVAF